MNKSNWPAERFAKLLNQLAPILLALFAALGALFYFAGSVYRNTLAGLMGLAANPEGNSLQTTMAVGAEVLLKPLNLPAVVVVLLGFGLILWYAYRIPFVKRIRLERHAKRQKIAQEAITYGWKQSSASFFSHTGLILMPFVLVSYMISVSSEGEAYKTYVSMAEDLLGPCDGCFAYFTESEVMLGIPVFQTDRQIYVRGIPNVKIVPIDELRYIRSCNAKSADAGACDISPPTG